MKNVIRKKNKGLINTYRTFRSFFFKNVKFLKKKKLFYFVKYQIKLKKKKISPLISKQVKTNNCFNSLKKKDIFNFLNLLIIRKV